MPLIQSYHPSSLYPLPTATIVAGELLRLWPLTDADSRFARLTVNVPTDRTPWMVTVQRHDRPPRTSKSRESVACFRSLTATRIAAKRMAMELLKGLAPADLDD